MIRKTLLLIISLLLSVNILFGKEFRSITSLLVETYSYGGYKWQVDDVFITRVSDDLQLILKGFHNQRVNLEYPEIDTVYSLNGSVGAIINLGPMYSEISYSLTGNLNDTITHSLYFDLTNEGAKFLYSPSLKIEVEGYDITLSPSFAMQYYEHPQFKIGGKLFSSFNLGKYNNAAIWLWGGYYPNIPLGFRFGVSTATLYSESHEEFNLDLSILPGLDYKINNKTTVKYNLNWNINNISYDTITHEIVFDIKL